MYVKELRGREGLGKKRDNEEKIISEDEKNPIENHNYRAFPICKLFEEP